MATVSAVAIQRSGPAIYTALTEHGVPGQLERFEHEMCAALIRAAEGFDLAEVDVVLGRWHALATMAANPLTDDEQAQLARAKAGELGGLRARDEHGNWITLQQRRPRHADAALQASLAGDRRTAEPQPARRRPWLVGE